MKILQALVIKIILTAILAFTLITAEGFLFKSSFWIEDSPCNSVSDFCIPYTPQIYWSRLVIFFIFLFIVSHFLYKNHQKRTDKLSKITVFSLFLIFIALLYIFLITTFSPAMQY